MVDAVVSFVVERLGDFLIQEAVFLRGVRNEVELLKNELEWMLCFIKNAEERQDGDPMVRKWVSDIRDIAYDVEDVLDKFLLKVDDEGSQGKRRSGFLASINMCACVFDKGQEEVNLYSIGKKIGDLRKRINDLSRKRELYGLENIGTKTDGKSNALGRLKQLRRATSFAVEENIVGFEDDHDKLLAKLLGQESRRFIISIFGMGGLGKTTLARKLYHNNDVKNRFDCCAWVSVSQDYNTEDLLQRIIKSFNMVAADNLEKMGEEDLERCLHNSLQGYSYLLVIDDVWQKETWESLKKAFPDNNNGSRIIITTRIKDVAERSDERTYFHELRFLRPNESWKLFCEKAFRNTNPDERLERLGKEMVQKCGGLPLAIVVLGGLLSTKKPQEWRTVRDHIWRHLRADSIQISYLLDLSFNDLSYQLKLCFLYFSVFPEDFEINMEKLVRLLVAEAFIAQNDGDRTMEEVARDNLHELINRSLIQVEKKCWGRVATCRVHDLLRDLSIQKAKELNFVHICDEINYPTPSSVKSSCRRAAVYSQASYHLWQQHANPLSCSLLLFNYVWRGACLLNPDLIPLCERFSLLRLLDIEASEYMLTGIFGGRLLPKEMGNLIHLKYLGLRNSKLDNVPPSIVNLKRLQTLDLSGGSGSPTNLPIEISKLQELRHLIGHFGGYLPIESLSNLQTLKSVEVQSWNKLKPDKLVNLRELRIEKIGWTSQLTREKVFTFDSIAGLKNLQILSVRLSDDVSFASLQPLSHCPCLIDLRLEGKIMKLPEDMDTLLPELECLSLTVSKLEEDPMPTLEKLLNLMILDLRFDSKKVKKLICTAQGFPRLEILQIEADGLKQWRVEKGAMPMLRGLKIPNISTLMIPKRLRSIPLPAEWECDDDM